MIFYIFGGTFVRKIDFSKPVAGVITSIIEGDTYVEIRNVSDLEDFSDDFEVVLFSSDPKGLTMLRMLYEQVSSDLGGDPGLEEFFNETTFQLDELNFISGQRVTIAELRAAKKRLEQKISYLADIYYREKKL